MNTSIIITCGYISKEKREDYDLENERLFAFEKCLLNLKTFDYSKGDEIVISEYGDSSKLKMFAHKSLEGCDFQYIFTKGSGFNQSIAKNAGAEIAKNEILLFINSDVILQKNVFEILRNRFERNPRIFATAARHDVWIEREELTDFIQIINNHSNYVGFSTNLDDPGWHHALKTPRKLIPTLIKALNPQVFQGRLIHDFQAGYINYGEFMAFTKDIWKKYPFDPEITAIVDSFIRDIIFGNEEGFSLELVHDETAVFHLSGSDYMGQENQSSGKYKRLIEDLYKAIDKYECMRHIAALAYFPEFDDLIEKHNIPVKQIFDEYSTPFMKKYAKNKEIASKKYGLDYTIEVDSKKNIQNNFEQIVNQYSDRKIPNILATEPSYRPRHRACIKDDSSIVLGRNNSNEFYRILRKEQGGLNKNSEIFTHRAISPVEYQQLIEKLKIDLDYRSIYSSEALKNQGGIIEEHTPSPGFGSPRMIPPWEQPSFDREYFNFLNSLVEDGDNVYDFGGGLSPFLALLDHGNKTLVDKIEATELMKPIGINYIDADLFPNISQKGIVFCFQCLEHLDNPEELLRFFGKFDLFVFSTPLEEIIDTSIYHHIFMQIEIFKKIFAELRVPIFFHINETNALDIHGIAVTNQKKQEFLNKSQFFKDNFKSSKDQETFKWHSLVGLSNVCKFH